MMASPPRLARLIQRAAPVLDMLMPMHLWLDLAGGVLQSGPTLEKMVGDGALIGRGVFDVLEIRRPIATSRLDDLLPYAGQRLALGLTSAPDLPLRGTLAVLPSATGYILDISLGLSFARAVREFDLTLSDFSPCDQTVELMYLHEANASTAALSRRLSERLETARAAAEVQALTDPLTGLANRRAMDQAIVEALADRQTVFTVLHIDLDFFKQVNDTLGHAAGDRVLTEVGRILATEVRDADLAARVGGDEFLVLLRDLTDATGVAALAQRLISRIEVPVEHDGHQCRVSASIGSATVAQIDRRPSLDEVLADTDVALYAAKRAGRGRHMQFDDHTLAAPEARRAQDPPSLRAHTEQTKRTPSSGR